MGEVIYRSVQEPNGRPTRGRKLVMGGLLLSTVLFLGVAFVLLFGKGCLSQRLNDIEISVVQADAVLKLPVNLTIDVTCELENANSSWVKIESIDYCVYIGTHEFRCDEQKGDDGSMKIGSNGKIETTFKVTPRPADAVMVVDAILSRRWPSEVHVEGRAILDSPVGRLKSDFKTKPVKFELRRVGFSVEAP